MPSSDDFQDIRRWQPLVADFTTGMAEQPVWPSSMRGH